MKDERGQVVKVTVRAINRRAQTGTLVINKTVPSFLLLKLVGGY